MIGLLSTTNLQVAHGKTLVRTYGLIGFEEFTGFQVLRVWGFSVLGFEDFGLRCWVLRFGIWF